MDPAPDGSRVPRAGNGGLILGTHCRQRAPRVYFSTGLRFERLGISRGRPASHASARPAPRADRPRGTRISSSERPCAGITVNRLDRSRASLRRTSSARSMRPCPTATTAPTSAHHRVAERVRLDPGVGAVLGLAPPNESKSRTAVAPLPRLAEGREVVQPELQLVGCSYRREVQLPGDLGRVPRAQRIAPGVRAAHPVLVAPCAAPRTHRTRRHACAPSAPPDPARSDAARR